MASRASHSIHFVTSLAFVAASLVAASASADAPAEPTAPRAPRFGDAGTVVFGTSGWASRASGTSDTPGASSYDYSNKLITGSVSGEYFLAHHLSVGATVGYFRTSSESGSPTTSIAGNMGASTSNGSGYRGGLRVGYYVPFGERVGFWPTARVDWQTASGESQTTGADGVVTHNSMDSTNRQLSLEAQLVFHVADHWMLRLVPWSFTTSSSTTSSSGLGGGLIGSSTSIGFGGWF